jgi:hypothetical protein
MPVTTRTTSTKEGDGTGRSLCGRAHGAPLNRRCRSRASPLPSARPTLLAVKGKCHRQECLCYFGQFSQVTAELKKAGRYGNHPVAAAPPLLNQEGSSSRRSAPRLPPCAAYSALTRCAAWRKSRAAIGAIGFGAPELPAARGARNLCPTDRPPLPGLYVPIPTFTAKIEQ